MTLGEIYREEKRLQVIEAYTNKEASMTAICDRFGISTKTAYKWYKRYLNFGVERTKRSFNKLPISLLSINRRTNSKALDLKRARLKWGPKRSYLYF
nr:hypothetical protein OJOKFFHK_00007 [uncultured bacterium]